jgi:serine acetyltransferase
LILPGTTIGKDCIIGAGSVVRGMVPDGSVVIGNPAKVVMTTAMARKLSARNRNILQVDGLSEKERDQVLRKHFGLDSGG